MPASACPNVLLILLAFFVLQALFVICCEGQGTLTITFDGTPRGTHNTGIGSYTESGMRFAPIPPGGIFLNGGGIAGYPDNGTAFLEIPDGLPGGVGGLTFGFTNSLPLVPFNLVSFDAAEYDSAGPQTLEVIGYKPMAGTVTNFFSVGSLTFQTFYLDSTFQNLYKVDVINARWSLDNLTISGVPEPSACALLSFGLSLALFRRRVLSRRVFPRCFQRGCN
jgi:hypothetical protein